MVTADTGGSAPAIYDCRVTHARAAPLRNVFSYRTRLWLVDLDRLPRPPRWLRPLVGFRAGDHFTGPGQTIRQRLDAFLAGRGESLDGGRVLMLTRPRVFGYVFNPLTVYWCHSPAGPVKCVVAEVHNTYHQRHAYLLHTDHRGRAETPKDFYVSPFFPVDGGYRMSLPEPGVRLALTITLHRPAGPPFAAAVRGQRVSRCAGRLTPRGLVSMAAQHPWPPPMVAAQVRWQGIKLWARGLPVQPRPLRPPQAHAAQEDLR